MAFSQLEHKRIEKLVEAFCRGRVPERAKSQLRYIYRIEGQNIFIAEDRPVWNNPDKWMALDFAKLTYVKSRQIWKLYWMRASGKWNRYEPFQEDSRLEKMLAVIGEDQYGCFFG
jgi:hypothetical protein